MARLPRSFYARPTLHVAEELVGKVLIHNSRTGLTSGTVSVDGDTVDGRWEMSKDGVTWNLDFELTYTRQR